VDDQRGERREFRVTPTLCQLGAEWRVGRQRWYRTERPGEELGDGMVECRGEGASGSNRS